jgi:hypothetical protein
MATTFTATKVHVPGTFDGGAMGRSELGIRMLCAWNNIAREDAPAFWSRHANDGTAMAWNRVAKAVRQYDAEQAALTSPAA